MIKGKEKTRLTKLRAFIFLSCLPSLVSLPSFVRHLRFFLSREVLNWTVSGNWTMVILSTAFFMTFLLFLKYRRKADWRGKGIFAAFFISLFIEMYGVPLGIYFSSKHLFGNVQAETSIDSNIRFLLWDFGVNQAILSGGIIILAGIMIIVKGWYDLYRSTDDKVVVEGIYRDSRHPQYVGIIMMVIGWLIVWPSILAILMGGCLIYTYLRLSVTEEAEMDTKSYKKYKAEVPFV